MADYGYFITEENRNDMYYKIISDSTEKDYGDKLIKALEKYLNSKNRLEGIIAPYENMVKFLSKLELAEDIEELNTEYENYMATFNS